MAKPPNEETPGTKKPPFLAQAAKALSQLALTFYVLMLLIALIATSGRHPNVSILMGILALVPLIFGPGAYRLIGFVALAIAGGFYANSSAPPKPQPKPAQQQQAPAAAQPQPVAPVKP